MYLNGVRIFSSRLIAAPHFVRSFTVNSTAGIVEERTAQVKSWKEIPGPSSLPLLGSLHHFLPGGTFYNLDGTDFTRKLYQNYGPIVKLDGMVGVNMSIFLFDAESVSQILRGENSMPIRSGFPSLEYYRKYYKTSKDPEEKLTGLLTEHLQPWKEFRSAVNPVMLQPKTIKLYTTAIDQVAQDMIARMRSSRDEYNMLRGNFDVEMNLWSLESIAVVALGTRLNCLDPTLSDDSPAKRLIQCVHDFFSIAEDLDFKPSIWKYIATPKFKKAMKLYEEHEKLSIYFIQKAMKELKANKGKSSDEKGVLEKLMDINEQYAYVMAGDMLFAGVDTAAYTMTATLYLLATNPEKQQKLREEVLSQSEKRPYLKACIKEAMRLMPVVPGNIRKTTKEYNVLGYHIPKNMELIFSHQEMSVMEQYYPRPKEYIPERWVADKDDPLYHGNAHPFAQSPFGFGVRMCIGRRIAELEVETFLGRIVENFSVEWFGPPPKVVQTALNYFKGPFNFIFKDV
uniref:Cytochrome P450 333B11 n=1 Tax=Manduca sexta TaxID=7130 RepID=D5L0N7_MANSE|nr:cytochrome P450 333B11 [Manduca sexta]